MDNVKLFIFLQRVQEHQVLWERCLQENDSAILLCNQSYATKLSHQSLPPGFAVEVVINYSLEYLTRHLQSITRERGVSFSQVRLSTNDEYCLELCGCLRAALNIVGPRYDEIQPFTNKVVMKKRLQGAVRLPKFQPFETACFSQWGNGYIKEVVTAIGLPLIVKPISEANNRGVQRLDTYEEVSNWCEQHHQAEHYQFEEYLQGNLIHCNTIVNEDRFQVIQICEYLWPCLQFSKGYPIGSFPLDPHDELYTRIVEFNYLALSSLSPLFPCVTHLELFYTPLDELVFLEVAARAPGALVSEMCRKATGLDLIEANLQLQMGVFTPPQVLSSSPPFFSWAWFPAQQGSILKLQTPKLHSQYHVKWHTEPGRKYARIGESVICELFFWHQDREKLIEDVNYLRFWSPAVIAPPS